MTLITLYKLMKMILSFLRIIFLSFVPCLAAQPLNHQYLLSENFEGVWKIIPQISLEGKNPWSDFEGRQGIAIVSFIGNIFAADKISGLTLEILMPKYYDQKMIKFTILFSKMLQSKNGRLQGITNITYQLFNDTRLVTSDVITDCNIAFDDSLIGLQTKQKLSILISFKPAYMSPNSSFLFALLAFTIILITKRTKNLEQTRIRHQFISIILSCILLFVVSIIQFIIGVRSLFGKMSPESFFTITSFMNLYICYRVTKFYWSIVYFNRWSIIFVWVFSCFYIWFLLFFRHNYICLILSSFVLIPQILYHFVKGQKVQSDIRWVILILTNHIYLLYFKSCPYNIFKESPNYLFFYCSVSLLIAQSLVYLGQIYMQPRFFLPKFLRPSYYDYFDVKQKLKAGSNILECHICLQQVKVQQLEKKKFMITPCNHLFHSKCLQQWMVVQMKCPVDRSELPPI